MKENQNTKVSSETRNPQVTSDTTVLVIHNQLNLLHASSKKHPQCPERITTIVNHISLLAEKKQNPNFKVLQYNQLVPKDDKSDYLFKQKVQRLIIQTHGQNYYQFIKQMFDPMFANKKQMFINIDTYYMKDTYLSAFSAAMTLMRAVDLTINYNSNNYSQKTNHIIDNPKYTVCVVRPPGHHSGMKSQPHGFSFFNNVAIGVNYSLKKLKNKKIAIIDWDVHHGQGTQKIFYDTNQVLFISMHRFDHGKFFPHVNQSSSTFIGKQKGKGFNVNVCWNIGLNKTQQLKQSDIHQNKGQKSKPRYQEGETVGDLQYIQCFKKLLLPILNQFDPQLIFVSCGFDAAQGDPIGGLSISSLGYQWMTNQLIKLGTKMIFVLQGGYDLQCLKWASEAVIKTLSASLGQRQKMEGQMNKNIDQLRYKMKKNLVGKRNGQTYYCNLIGFQGITQTFQAIKNLWKVDI